MNTLHFLILGGCLVLFLYIIIAIFFFFYQEKLIFFPRKLEKSHVFTFPFLFEERVYKPIQDVRIHSILAKTAETSKGLIFYLHGNGGNIQRWGNEVVTDFLELGYDVFMMDYRSYGKSTGEITEQAFLDDATFLYQELKKEYPEHKIHLYGKSLGASLAAYLAIHNSPNQLIMETPFHSMQELAMHYFPWLPSFLLKYPFPTHQYCLEIDPNLSITLFHGTDDEVVPHDSSLKIKEQLEGHKLTIYLIPKGKHYNLNAFKSYYFRLTQILS